MNTSDAGGPGDGGTQDGRRSVPRVPRRDQPAGIERARRTAGAPPRSSLRGRATGGTGKAAPPEPPWPPDATVDLPRGVLHELRNQVRGGKDLTDRVAQALTIGGDAIEDGAPELAVSFLAWAKHHAPRSSAIREALGVAYYHAEQFDDAVTELQAYRRMTGHQDQNHVLADCLRAAGEDTASIGELVQQMEPGRDGADRYTEGVIVWASALADAGDVGAGRAVLRRLLDGRRTSGRPEEHDLRLWYVAADLAARAGDTDDAQQWFARVREHDEDYFDVQDRLAALRTP